MPVKPRSLNKLLNRGIIYVCAIIVALAFLAPFGWLVIASLQKEADLLSVPPHIIPKDPTLITYQKLLRGQRLEADMQAEGVRTYSVPREAKLFPTALGNSFIVSASTTILCLIVGSLSAYSMARLNFKGGSILLLVILATRMVPGLTLVIPFFLLGKSLGLLDSKIALIIVYSTFTLPYTIWILKAFFETIPPDIEDAARIDGCTRFQAFWRIILPVAQSGLVGAAIFIFMLAWNEFFFALILTNTESAFTVPVISGMFATELDIDYSLMLTSGVLAVIPPVLFTFIFQRFIITGLAAGSVKG